MVRVERKERGKIMSRGKDETLTRDITAEATPVMATPQEVEDTRLSAMALQVQKDSLTSEKRLKDAMEANAQYAPWMSAYDTPDMQDAIEITYEGNRRQTIGNADLTESHRSKRKSHYFDKAKTQSKGNHMIHRLFKDRKDAVRSFTEENPRVKVEKKDVSFAQDWCAYYHKEEYARNHFSMLAKVFSDDEAEKVQEAENMAQQVLAVDLNDFAYKDDQEFMQKFDSQYRKICAMANSEKVIRLLDHGLPNERVIRLKARIRVLNDIREDYENRMQILQSPYYAFLSGADATDENLQKLWNEEIRQAELSEQLGEEVKVNQVLRDYIIAMQKRKNLKLKAGVSATDLEKDYLSHDEHLKRFLEHQVFEKKFNGFLDRSLSGSEEQDTEEVVQLRYKVASFKGVLRTKIPGNPAEIKSSADGIFSQYETVIDGMNKYVTGMKAKKALTEEEKKDLAEAEEIYQHFLDEQTVFIEAYGRLEQKGLAGLGGIWLDVLLSVDAQKVLKPADVEDSMMRHEHVSMMEMGDELIQKGMDQQSVVYEKSPEMARIRTAFGNFGDFLSKPVTRGEGYEASKGPVMAAYQEIMASCASYRDTLNADKKALEKKEIQRRVELLGQIIDQCTLEKDALEALTQPELIGTKDQTGGTYAWTWSDALYCIRAIKISKDDPNITVTGAGTSVVYRMQQGDSNPSYVKKSEKLAKSDDDLASALQMYAEAGDAHIKEVAERLAKIARIDGGVSALKQIKDEYYEIRVNTDVEWEQGVSEEDYKKHEKEVKRGLTRVKIKELMDTFPKELKEFAEKQIEDLVDFTIFYCKKDTEYSAATANAGIKPEAEMSSRNVSTSRLAETFGITEIVASSKTVLLVGKDGQMERANEMEGVESRGMWDLIEYCRHNHLTLKMSPNFVRQITTLQLFDVICGQVDRNFANFNVFFDASVPGEITMTSLKAIDNDMAFGERRYKELFDEELPFINPPLTEIPLKEDSVEKAARQRKKLNDIPVPEMTSVPFIDGDFYDKIMAFDPNTHEGLLALQKLRHEHVDIRTEEETYAMLDRLINLRETIKKMTEGNPPLMEVIRTPQGWEGKAEQTGDMMLYKELGRGHLGMICAYCS